MTFNRIQRRLSRACSIFFMLATAASLPSCGNDVQTLSSTKVVGGQDVPNAYPAVVGLLFRWAGYRKDSEYTYSSCTGTFIRDDIVLTAAHCKTRTLTQAFSKGKLLDVTMYGSGVPRKQPVVSTKVSSHQAYFDEKVDHDVAAVFFPHGAAPAVARVANASGKSGDKVHFVGFGIDSVNSYLYSATPSLYSIGAKRVGTTVLNSQGDGLVIIQTQYAPDKIPQPGQSMTAPGDSGGPLFNDREEIIAVNSSILMREFEHPRLPHKKYIDHVLMYFPNVKEPSNEQFISSLLAAPSDHQPTQPGSWCTKGFRACFVFCTATDRASPAASGFGKTQRDGQEQWCRIPDESAVATNMTAKYQDLPKSLVQSLGKGLK